MRDVATDGAFASANPCLISCRAGFLQGRKLLSDSKHPWQQELSEATNGLRVTDKVARRMVKEEQ
jgi:hypothetical protein